MEAGSGIFSIDILETVHCLFFGFLGYIHERFARSLFYIALSLAFYIWLWSVYRVGLFSRLSRVL